MDSCKTGTSITLIQKNDSKQGFNLEKEHLSSYKITMNVENYKSDEVVITAKPETKSILVEAKHLEKKNDILLVSQQLVRTFSVPEEYCIYHFKHSINNEILLIKVPLKKICEACILKINAQSTKSTLSSNKSVKQKRPEFRAQINVGQYSPEEITVDTNLQKRMISVEAKHIEQRDNLLCVASQFTRKFSIPVRYKIDEVYHKINDGVLSIHIPVDSAELEKSAEQTKKEAVLPEENIPELSASEASIRQPAHSSASDWSRVSSADSLEWDPVQSPLHCSPPGSELDTDTQQLLNEIERLTDQALRETGCGLIS